MKNQKGFSLIELLAVILISTSVIVPLIFSLSSNFDTNVRLINKSVATTVTTSALQGFQDMYYQDIEIVLETSSEPFIIFNADNGCDLLRTASVQPRNSFNIYTNNQGVCDQIFDIQSINRSFSSEEFMVVVFPYRVEDISSYQASVNQAYSDGRIPLEVRDTMLDVIEGESLSILRIVTWVQYGDDASQNVTRSGLLSPEVEVEEE
ncbi:MAG: type II secretion system protein [Candidatus Izemoplasmataceae bacterium]